MKIFIFSILPLLKKWLKSDTTTGALQFVDGMTLFYCDANEDVMIPKGDFQISHYTHADIIDYFILKSS